MKKEKADITEIFSSVQGEGIFLGARQVFIRFKKCNLNCAFCDVPKDLKTKDYTCSELIRETKFLENSKGPHHSVSLTGGEPLLYVEFLKDFLKFLKKEGLKSYLETNGTLPDNLSKIIDLIDIIAMDFKLPSSTREKEYWREHLEFLRIAMKKKVFVKAVVTPSTKGEDIEKAASLLRKVNERIPFILQPATPVRSSDRKLDNGTLLSFMEIVSKNHLQNIRAIPQVHKILNVR
jgi:organic radical activating enzyme